MNLESRFKACADFLSKWHDFLALEPIRNYPKFCPKQLEPWVEELMTKPLVELVNLENEFTIDTDHFDFTEYLSKIKELISFPRSEYKTKDIPQEITKKISLKKKHEIEKINAATESINGINIIDICAGAGYLSESLIHQKERFSYCIDLDSKLQESGLKRIESNFSKNTEKINFITADFNESFSLSPSHPFNKNLVVGLHACGDLTPYILKYFTQSNFDHLLSFGCCYQKLTNQYNLSSLSKEIGLEFTTNAFNLAARGYGFQTYEGLEQKIKIRRYRYAVQLLFLDNGETDFISIGRTNVTDYEQSFTSYVNKYAPRINSENLENFYNANLKAVDQIIYTDIIRGLLGRVLESYLVLDRALFLKEKGYDSYIEEVFDRKLSPRNLGIFAQKTNQVPQNV